MKHLLAFQRICGTTPLQPLDILDTGCLASPNFDSLCITVRRHEGVGRTGLYPDLPKALDYGIAC